MEVTMNENTDHPAAAWLNSDGPSIETIRQGMIGNDVRSARPHPRGRAYQNLSVEEIAEEDKLRATDRLGTAIQRMQRADLAGDRRTADVWWSHLVGETAVLTRMLPEAAGITLRIEHRLIVASKGDLVVRTIIPIRVRRAPHPGVALHLMVLDVIDELNA